MKKGLGKIICGTIFLPVIIIGLPLLIVGCIQYSKEVELTRELNITGSRILGKIKSHLDHCVKKIYNILKNDTKIIKVYFNRSQCY